MNPFDLRGPEFLAFYAIFAAVVILAIILIRRSSESGDPPKIDLADPYLIAYLRGGENEALRVATVSLIDRGLLKVKDTQIKRAGNAGPASVRRPIEQALLEKFRVAGEANSVFGDSALKASCDTYKETLRTQQLLPDSSISLARLARFLIALVLLGGVAAVKILVALARGRTNILFLVILALAAVYIAARVSFPRLTAKGKALLKDIQTLYSDLRGRSTFVRPGGGTAEAVMLAAVFGVSALAGDAFAYTKTLFPRAHSSGSGSSCGSSCGSSSGSSCGGGGCGGGCGGCGG